MSCSPLFIAGLVLALGVSLILSFAGAVGQTAIALGFVVSAGLLARHWFGPAAPPVLPSSTSPSRDIPDLIQGLSRGRG
jgi:hypothetical protein